MHTNHSASAAIVPTPRAWPAPLPWVVAGPVIAVLSAGLWAFVLRLAGVVLPT